MKKIILSSVMAIALIASTSVMAQNVTPKSEATKVLKSDAKAAKADVKSDAKAVKSEVKSEAKKVKSEVKK